MEWPAAFGNSKRAGRALTLAAVGAFMALASLTLLWIVARALPKTLASPTPRDLWGCCGSTLTAGLAASLAVKAFRRTITLASDTGSARLVLHHDSLIWVAGGGTLPQVWRKSEITSVAAIPTLKPRRVGFVLEDAPHPRFHIVLKGRFAPGDLVWLGDVLKRWFATRP